MEHETSLAVRVKPNAKKNEFLGFSDNTMSLKIAAPPVDGKANAELVRFLSSLLGIPKSRISVRKGATGRNKLLNLGGITAEELEEKLDRMAQEKDHPGQPKLL